MRLLWNSLAWRNLVDHPVRLITAAGAIALVVTMMFMQLGFLHGFNDGNARLLQAMEGDLLVVNARKDETLQLDPLPWRRVQQARAVTGVVSAWAVYVKTYEGAWRDVKTGKLGATRVIGVDPESDVFAGILVGDCMERLKVPDTVAFDRMSRDFVARPRVGEVVELCGRRMRVAGYFDLGTDIDANMNVVVSKETFARCYPPAQPSGGERASSGWVSGAGAGSIGDARPNPEYIAVKVDRDMPGVTVEGVRRALKEQMPMDVEVVTHAEMRASEVAEAARQSPLAPLLMMGVVIGFIVGVVICSQVLFNEVNDRAHEFAVLKALGQDAQAVSMVVVWQALILAVLGFVPGVVLSVFCYRWLEAWCTLPMSMRLSSVLLIGVVTVLMCLMAGLLAVRRVAKTDPAELF